RGERQLDEKDTASAWEVPKRNPAAIGFDGPATDRQTETETRAVRTPLFEWAEDRFDRSRGQSATLVLDFEPEATCRGTDPEPHLARRPGELERVLQQVGDRGGEEVAVDIHEQIVVQRLDDELKTTTLCVDGGVDLHLLDELRHGESFSTIRTRTEPHL